MVGGARRSEVGIAPHREASGVNSSGRLERVDRGGGGALGRAPKSGARTVHNFAPTWALKARMRTKTSATGAFFWRGPEQTRGTNFHSTPSLGPRGCRFLSQRRYSQRPPAANIHLHLASTHFLHVSLSLPSALRPLRVRVRRSGPLEGLASTEIASPWLRAVARTESRGKGPLAVHTQPSMWNVAAGLRDIRIPRSHWHDVRRHYIA